MATSSRPRASDVVAFLGPSLPAREARRLGPCRVLPPARAGDVLAVLPERPLAIALVDGVFETTPSVWQHELLLALDAGVAVFGGGSMGALRAAELAPLGVVGVGRIFRWYRDGKLMDVSYWCEVCSIRSVDPGPCFCCQGKVELRESPAEAER